MKKLTTNLLLASLITLFGFGFLAINVYAEDGAENGDNEDNTPKTGLTLTPVNRTLQISSDSTYDGSLNVTNDGGSELKIRVKAAPYSYTYEEAEDSYKLGYSHENSFTQISRWITIEGKDGSYATEQYFTIPANENLDINYRITTPSNIPAGGQYAVIFVKTIAEKTEASGIRTEASAGMIVYGHSTEGEAKIVAEIRDSVLGQGTKSEESNTMTNHIYGQSKVKNNGNVDFLARGKLKIEPIIGFSSYETPNNAGLASIIPESEQVVQDEWAETHDFGIYKVTWTITSGDKTDTVEQIFFLISPLSIIITLIVLTIIVLSIIIGVRRRKERRSRLAV